MESQCSICFDAITSQTGKVVLGCSHSYHFKCIAQWMSSSTTCPCCRGKFNQYEHIPMMDDTYDDLDDPWDVIYEGDLDLDVYHIASALLALNTPIVSTLNPYAEPYTPS